MAKTAFASVDAYLAAQPTTSRPTLELVRRTIREALPDAEEVISYQIPAYRLHGAVVLYFAGWREHYALYPVGDGVLAAFAAELGSRVVSKGTIRFPLEEPVPVTLIAGIARLRADEAATRAAEKKAAKRSAKQG